MQGSPTPPDINISEKKETKMNKIEEYASVIGDLLIKSGLNLSVAESCTGGMIGAALTSIAGSSRYFRGGVIAYDNQIKEELLHVSQSVLFNEGAVSAHTVEEMALGICKLFKTDCAITVSGIAGPDGGTALKPVGLVYIGTAVKSTIRSYKCNFNGNRDEIRLAATQTALDRFISDCTELMH